MQIYLTTATFALTFAPKKPASVVRLADSSWRFKLSKEVEFNSCEILVKLNELDELDAKSSSSALIEAGMKSSLVYVNIEPKSKLERSICC